MPAPSQIPGGFNLRPNVSRAAPAAVAPGKIIPPRPAASAAPPREVNTQAAAAEAPTDLVVIDIGLIVRLSTYLGPEPNLYTLHDYDEPYLRIKVLYEGLDHPYASLADPQRQAFLLVRAPDENHRLTTLAVAAELVATFPKPNGELQYELYRLTPD